MEFARWLIEHWRHFLEEFGVLSGLLVAAISFYRDTRVRRVETFVKMTEHHRDLWLHFYASPHLAGILDPNRDMATRPLSGEEAQFVSFLFNHLDGVFRASKAGISVRPESLADDIRGFLALPAPRAAWDTMKPMLDRRFAAFVERALSVRK